jgi:N-methylhydantoinase A/oxoprolinase/acetone carboxylase beta subunit
VQVLSLVQLVIGDLSFCLSLSVFTYHRFCFHGIFRKGGPLAVTDANLLLGRLIPEFFPKIFGKSEKEPLDAEASKTLFEKVAAEINESHEGRLSLDEVVYG